MSTQLKRDTDLSKASKSFVINRKQHFWKMYPVVQLIDWNFVSKIKFSFVVCVNKLIRLKLTFSSG